MTAAPAPEAYAYDVFISYSRVDKAWVQGELLRRLEDAQLRVCIDYRGFELGAPIVREIEQKVLASHKTLLMLTPDYLTSDWVKYERFLLQTEDPVNDQRRIIPLLKASCDLPTSIKCLTHIDFIAPDDVVFAWTQLLTALGKRPPI